MAYRDQRIRDSARGETCTMRLHCCNRSPDTTVWAHSNKMQDGKGKGLKADDDKGAYMCSACHDEYDGRTHITGLDEEELSFIFDIAMEESRRRLRIKGLIT